MACNTCQETKQIPVCTTEVIIGTVVPTNTPVYIFVKNESTGYTHRQDAETTSDGEVILDLSQPDPSFYNPNSIYTCWMTLTSVTENVKMSITIGDTQYTCFNLHFNRLFNSNLEIVEYSTHTLEVEE